MFAQRCTLGNEKGLVTPKIDDCVHLGVAYLLRTMGDQLKIIPTFTRNGGVHPPFFPMSPHFHFHYHFPSPMCKGGESARFNGMKILGILRNFLLLLIYLPRVLKRHYS